MDTKICTKCGANYTKYRARGGWCKDCKRAYDYANNQANKITRRLSKTKCDHITRANNKLIKLKNRVRCHVMRHMRKKSDIVDADIGLTPKQLKVHIESQFYPNPTTNESMTWDKKGNGPGTWQIDHTIPLASAKTEEDMKAIANYSNLKPLWWDDHHPKTLQESILK